MINKYIKINNLVYRDGCIYIVCYYSMVVEAGYTKCSLCATRFLTMLCTSVDCQPIKRKDKCQVVLKSIRRISK